jgi:hypothetical protein
MSAAIATIVRLERNVMWRRRLLSLQKEAALAVAIGGGIAAGLVLFVRLRPLQVPAWIVITSTLSLCLALAGARWFLRRSSQRDAAFMIDASLDLEDRVSTSHLIIERGGPAHAIEEAVIEDTAQQIGDRTANAVVPLRMVRWHALPLLSLVALTAALMITPRTLPLEALRAERADIESAAEHLERSAVQVEQTAPADTETAGLAAEQAELGREFRRSATTRTEALKRLSALEDRIRQRHRDLASTHADEIVSLADRRLGGALSTLSKPRPKQTQSDEDHLATSVETSDGNSRQTPAKQTQATTSSTGREPVRPPAEKGSNSSASNSQSQASTKEAQQEARPAKAKPGEQVPQNRPQERISGNALKPESRTDASKNDSKSPPAKAGDSAVSREQQPPGKTADARTAGNEDPAEQETGDKRQSDKPADSPGAAEALPPNPIAERATKALPKLSEELLKNAARLRARELSPADIEKLRKAAESLSGELTQIAQSEELQRALQEMAREIRPEQIEQVARALEGQEKLKQELESAARLLMENRQAKEMAAGLFNQFARSRDEIRLQQQGEPPDGRGTGAKSDSASEQTKPGVRASQETRGDIARSRGKLTTSADGRLAGQGRESSLQGHIRSGSAGEYLYLQSKAGSGAARAPYSSAYPQYRREAERSVQRTQVPSNLRSVVRRYFDAINPEAKK